MNVIIIGAGVIGSAIAYYLSRKGIEATAVSYTHLTLPTNREV